jgi:hypothetical protein
LKSAILSFINSGWQWGILTNLGGNSYKIPTQIEETENDQPDLKGEDGQATIMTTVGKRIGLAVKYETLRGVAPILHQSLAPSAAWRKNLALAGTLRTLMNLGGKAGQGKAGIYHPGFHF